jgi:hypothetical protein
VRTLKRKETKEEVMEMRGKDSRGRRKREYRRNWRSTRK